MKMETGPRSCPWDSELVLPYSTVFGATGLAPLAALLTHIHMRAHTHTHAHAHTHPDLLP